MTSAPLKRSVPHAPSSAQQKTPTDIAPARARFDARRRAMSDKALTFGARVLYAVLDDFAGGKAHAWPSQQTLADHIGCSGRQVIRYLDELEARGYLVRDRGRNRVDYRLCWVPQELTDASPVELTDTPPELTDTSVAFPLYEPGNEPGACRCGGAGWIWYEGQRWDGPYRKRVRCGCHS